MNIAIIGSREGFTQEEIAHIIYKEFEGSNNNIITGGAAGVDTFAIDYAMKHDINFQVIRPVNKDTGYGIKMNYIFRNIEIITKADKVIAFWDGKSRGTKFVIDYAKARGKLKDEDIHTIR